MTQSNPTPALVVPRPSRRSPDEGYRQQMNRTGVSFTLNKRVLGMWVPGEAFRQGTIIRLRGHSSTASPVLQITFGGNGSAVNLGIVGSWTTGPGTACGFDLSYTQRTDGIQPNLDSSGFFSGATSLVVTTAALQVFIQPMNFIEITVGGSYVLHACTLEVIPPQSHGRSYQNLLDI